jgi:hypothetical protein
MNLAIFATRNAGYRPEGYGTSKPVEKAIVNPGTDPVHPISGYRDKPHGSAADYTA